ncbi:hypothetical protein [Moraxella lacunata]
MHRRAKLPHAGAMISQLLGMSVIDERCASDVLGRCVMGKGGWGKR